LQYFTLTVDTEADNAWTSPEKIEMKNFKELIRFQELCEKYNIIPTYLLTYEYATYKPAIDYLKPKAYQRKCEIGHHLHVWTTPPLQKEQKGIDIEWLHAYQYELPDNLFYDKANMLYNTIEKNFGLKPKSHRAGRWGIDNRTIDWLVNKNFLVDTSVVPGKDYTDSKGVFSSGPNFQNQSSNFFFWKTNKSKILEVPVSVYNNFFIFNKAFIKNIYKFIPNNKKGSKLSNISILRLDPAYSYSFYKNAISGKLQKQYIVNMMLHSSELALNCSPKSKIMKYYKKNWLVIEHVFRIVRKLKLISCSLSEISLLYKKYE